MHYSNRVLRRLALAALLGLSSLAASAQVAVIVNPKSGVTSLTVEQVSSLYLGKTSTLPGGLTQAVDLGETNPTRELFYGKATSFFTSAALGSSFGGAALPENISRAQTALTCDGVLPVALP